MAKGLHLKTWRVNEKEINLFHHDGNYQFAMNDGLNSFPIALQNIEGIPFEKLNDPDSVIEFLKDSYIKLHALSEENQFKLYVFQSLAGGANIIDPDREPKKLWPKEGIPFEIDTVTYPVNQEGRAMIMEAIEEWNNSGAGFKLVPRTDQEDYLVFGENENDCNSYVGRMGGRQYIQCDLDGGSYNASSVMHEIGHAIGLHHEQQRNDRDKHVKVISKDFTNYGKRGIPFGQYDFNSIMHYPFDKDMRPKYNLPNRKQVGNMDHLSEGDIAAAQYLYQKSLKANVTANNSQIKNLSRNSMSFFAQAKQPPVWKILKVRGEQYFNQQNYSKAFDFYSALLNEYGSVMTKVFASDIYTQLGKCCYELNQLTDAYQYFSQAVEWNPKNKTAEEYCEELAPNGCSAESCLVM